MKGEPLVVIVRVTRLGRVGGRYLADCDLIAVERGETAFKKGDRFQVRLWPPTRQLRDPGPVPQRMVFEEPLKPLYEGHCEAVARNEDLGVEEGEESDRWATVAVVRVKEIKKYLLGPEDLDVTGADIGQERRSAACELVRVVKGTSEVGPGEDFKIRSCAPEYDFVVDRETDGPVDVVVRIGFEEVLKHRVQGYWCVLSILR